MLESAAVCAYDCAEHLDGPSLKKVLAVGADGRDCAVVGQ
ncbi:hypothetical protein [Pseudomonas simiae]